MNILKSALRHIQAVWPKRWHRPKPLPQANPSMDRFEVLPAPKQRPRAPTIDWADIDRRLPQGDPLVVMDQVLGSSARYSVIRGADFYQLDASTTTSLSVASIMPTEPEAEHK